MISQLQRFRTLIVALLVVVAIVFIPSDADEGVTGVSSGGPAGQLPSGPAGTLDTGPSDSGAEGSLSGTPGTSAAGSGVQAGGTSTGAGGGGPPTGPPAVVPDGSVVIGGVAYPGLGTEAALANPNCDPAPGTIRIPTFSAPRCVTQWPAGADNLGVTSQGVTADAITIVVFHTPSRTETPDDRQALAQFWPEIVEAFAHHYELWGRRIDLKIHDASGSDEVAQRADAVEVFNKYKPFMTIDPIIAARPAVIFSAEMAARGVIAWDHQPPWKDTQGLAPFRYGVGHDERLFAESIAEFAAKSLQGRPAQHAGDPAMQLEERKFGLIYPDTWDISFFNGAKEQFGLNVADQIAYRTEDITSYQEQSRVQMARLDQAGVNNILAAAELLYLPFATREATARNYFPEWTLTGWGVSDVTLGGRLYDPAQTANMFGIGPVPVLVEPVEDQVTSRYYAWHHGRPPDDNAAAGVAHLLLEQIFIGLQNAGPNLNPETYRNAMFAEPPKGGFWCKCVTSSASSFGRWIEKPWDDYSAWDHFVMKWWKTDESSQDEVGITAAGTFVMVNNGQQFIPGSYPTEEPPFFVNENFSHHMTVDQMPPQDKPQPYEHDESLHIIPPE
jgi:hypothetical protein